MSHLSLIPGIKKTNQILLPVASALAALLLGNSAQATTYYWDTNAAAGFTSETGAWNGTNAFWNTDSTGATSGTFVASPTSADDLNISGGTTGTITISGVGTGSSLTISDNVTTTITGGTLALGGAGTSSGLFVTSADNSTTAVSSALTLNNAAVTIQNAGTGALTVSGGITGSQDLILKNNGATAAGITISTGSVNNAGAVTNSGAGAGGVTISSVIGTNVTGVTQNSSTSPLTLSGVNTYTGATTISAGLLTISGQLGSGSYAGNILNSGTFNYSSNSAQTLSGVISGTGALTKGGSGTLTLSNANTSTGATIVNLGILTLSGTGSIASSVITDGGSGTTTLNLDYTGAAANASVSRVSGSSTLTVQANANLYFVGNTTTATQASIGTLALGPGFSNIGISSGSGLVTQITAAGFSRGAHDTGAIRGTALGTMGSATTANQLILANTTGLGAQVGTTVANNLAVSDTTKNLQIVPYLVSDSSYNGSQSSTFVTYDSTLGFRALSTANEFSAYATAATGDNASVTAATTGAATKTINSLLMSNATLTGAGGGSNVMTVSSGAILATTTGTISGFDGITLGNNEGVITNASGITTTINSAITINNGSGNGGSLTKSGAGTLILGANNDYTGVTTVNGGTLQVGAGGSSGNLGATSGIALNGGQGGATLIFNTTSAINLPSVAVTGANAAVALTRAATSTGALTLGSVTGLTTITDNSTNGASAPTTFNQVGTGNTITTITGTSGSVVNFASSDGTASTTIGSSAANGNLLVAGQLIKVSSGSVTIAASNGNYSSNLEVDGGTLSLLGFAGSNGGTLTLTGGTLNSPLQSEAYVPTASNLTYTANQSGGTFNSQSINLGSTTALAGSVSTYNLSGGTLNINTGGKALVLNADTGGVNTSTFNLSGGKLFAGVKISGGGSTGAKQAFVWTGGTLVTPLFDATNLTSTAGTAASAATNTLTNAGGILAPGDVGSGGLFAITGNYAVTSTNAVYAVDIGSATAGTSTFSAASYDQTTVSGTTTLGGRLNFNVINSYTPANNTTTLYKVLVGSASGVTGSFTNQVTATSGNSRVVGADGLSSFLIAINNTGSTATTGGLTSVTARTVALGGYQAANTYNAASGGTWDAANAASWSNFDPGATAAPATQASSAVGQFADGASTGTGVNTVSLNSTRNIQGIQFASATAGHNYTLTNAGSGSIIFDNTSNAAAATITDSSASGNANDIEIPITLNSNLVVSVTNAANRLTIGGAIGETAVGSTLTKTGSGTVVFTGTSTYTGATTVSAGKLIISGGIQGSAVTVASLATLAGTGTIAPTRSTGSAVDITGTLAPGDTSAIGQISFTLAGTSTVTFEAGSKLTLNVGAASASSVVAFNAPGNWLSGSGNATLQLNGTVDYASTYTVFGNQTTLFGFAGITGYDSIDYTAQLSLLGNNEVLTFIAVPEPSSYAMMLSGLSLLGFWQRSRRRTA